MEALSFKKCMLCLTVMSIRYRINEINRHTVCARLPQFSVHTVWDVGAKIQVSLSGKKMQFFIYVEKNFMPSCLPISSSFMLSWRMIDQIQLRHSVSIS